MQWNQKYSFPKNKESSLFDYKVKNQSKIDILNKHLEKKILNKKKESDLIENFNKI